MTWPRLLFSLLLAPLAFGAADVGVQVRVAEVPFYGEPNALVLAVTNHGPDRATSVVLTANVESADPRCVRTASGTRCELSSLGAGQTVEVGATHLHRGNVGTHARVVANVTTTSADPSPSNDEHVLFYVPVLPAAEVVTEIRFPDKFNDDGTLTIRYNLRNQHVEYPALFLARISIPEAAEFVRANGDCRGTPASLECTVPVPASTTYPLDVTVRLPEQAGRVTTRLIVFWIGHPDIARAEEGARTYTRRLLVTTAADSGPGSLRQILTDANGRCEEGVPCHVHFAIADPLPPEGWFTIRPLTPLPEITAPNLLIDATTQSDTNALGPEVLLDGSALRSGSGLSVRGGAVSIAGLAIGNFPENAIFGLGRLFLIARSYIGVDPTGTRAMPNHRGIMIGAGMVTVANSVISGNVRSGIFVWNAGLVSVYENRIGVAAATDDPIPNGASGVFVGSNPQGMFGTATMFRNVIANNGHFGIAYPREVGGHVGPNDIYNNGLSGIDIDLDGPSPDLGPVPVITRAYWDGIATVIEGTTPPWTTGPISERFQVLLFANSELEAGGYAEGERHFGTVAADLFGRFTLRYSGDLRGLYVNGVTIRRTNFHGEFEQARTSEFGQAIRVADQP